MNKITEDNRLHATHVSLYISLFTLWNLNRFENPISINREEVMKISKIGSRNTYHKCLKDLDLYGYLEYLPSHNPLKGSLINIYNFDTSSSTSSEQALGKTSPKNDTSIVQAVSPSLNRNKHRKQSNTHVNQNKNFNEPL